MVRKCSRRHKGIDYVRVSGIYSWDMLRYPVTPVGAGPTEVRIVCYGECKCCVDNLPLSKSVRGKGDSAEAEPSWSIVK